MPSAEKPCPAPMQFCRHRGLRQAPEAGERPSIPVAMHARESRRLVLGALAASTFWAGSIALGLATGSLTLLTGVASGAALLGALGLALRASRPAPFRALNAFGSLYFLLAAGALALNEFSSLGSLTARSGVSWSAVWIALFPFVVPCTPRHTFVRALIAASLSPLAFFLVASNAGYGVGALAVLFAPVYIAASFAYVAARVLSALRKEVVAAREMGMYELDSRIAQGGMGEVWRAKHRLLSRPAAVKLIRAREGGSNLRSEADVVAERRFEREAQVTASLKSPHTVELYDFGVTDSGTIYYVMELLEGSDLEDLVRRDGPLPPKRVVHILKQALDSLAEAHDHGLIHRDIKPANLHVSQRGLEADFVKVLDFGLVKDSGRKKIENSITAANGIVGTPAYLAPELITGEGLVDGRADLYSLGAVAYFLLTGRLVFDAQTPMLMAVAHVTSAPLPPSQRTEQVIPPSLDRLVLSCLAKRPEDRPGSARALLRMLEELDFSEEAPRARSPFTVPVSRPDNSLN
jgi:hypothetical protein